MWKCYKQKELLKALTSTDNDETRKEFCVKFGVFLKNHFCASIQQSFLVGELSASQKQAIIKLIKKKKDRDKLIVDMKLISSIRRFWDY